MKALIGSILVLILSAGCRFGGKISQVYVANNPEGTPIEFTTINKDEFTGEYLGLKGDTLIFYSAKIRIENEVAAYGVSGVEEKDIQKLNFQNNRKLIIDKSHNRHNLDKTPVYSRYPQGINDSLLKTILEAYKQDSLVFINVRKQ